MHSNNSKINKIFLSLLALLALVSLAVGITYSWIEGGITYTISGKVNSAASKTTTYGTVNATPLKAGTTLALSNFDYVTNKDLFHFTPVSGDGENFFFNIGTDSVGKAVYRQADTNDVGTKFINFDFDVLPERNCDVYLSEIPTVELSKNNFNDLENIDTSDFRFMIKGGGETKLLSNIEKGTSEEVNIVTSTDGTTSVCEFLSTANFEVNENSISKLFSLEKGKDSKIEVSIWLDSTVSEETLKQLSGCQVKIDLKLLVKGHKVDIKVEAVGFPTTDSTLADAVYIGEAGKTSYSAYEEETVKLTAVDKDGYTFQGWYKDKACTENNKLSSNTITVNEEIFNNKGATYYAKYAKNYTITFNAGTGGYVGFESFTGTGEISVTKEVPYNGSVTLYAVEKDGYQLKNIVDSSGTVVGTESGKTISNISKSETYTAVFEEIPMNTIYFRPPSNWKTANAWFAAWAWSTSTDGKWCTFEDSDGDGIYSADIPEKCIGINLVRLSPNCAEPTFTKGDNLMWNRTGDISIPSTDENLVKLTINSENWDDVSDTWHNYPVTVNVAVNNSSYGSAKIDSASSIVTYSGHGATLTATPTSSSYEFVGWTDSNGNSVGTTDTSQTIEISGEIGEIITYTANFQKVSTTRTIYFKPSSDWKSQSAKFACYVWGGSGSAKWVAMTDSDGDGIYSATIEKTYTSIIFSRFASNVTTYSFDTDWNQTVDLTIPTNGNNTFTITTSFNKDNKGEGTWS